MAGARAAVMVPPDAVDLSEVQSLVMRPRPACRIDIAFLRCASRDELAEVLLAGLAELDVAATTDRGKPAINLALTAAGIGLVGIDDRAYRSLSAPFREGMRASALGLGDEGESDPARWVAPFDPTAAPVHVAVIALGRAATRGASEPHDASAPDEAWWGPLAPYVAPADPAAAPVVWTGRRRTEPGRPGAYEPFGFRDDVSVPEIAGSGRRVEPGDGLWDPTARRWRAVRAGEAVMGYVDEAGVVAGHPDAALVERDGSYLVLRRLRQHRARFEAETEAWAAQVGLRPEVVRERVVGRHRDGRALGQPLRDPPEPPANGFLYRSDIGPGGTAAPSSHIRRSNPRDDLHSADRIMPRHQVFRRGISYGEPGGDEGLLFMSVGTDIRRQFEFVQSHWLQDGNRFGLGREQDALTGGRNVDPGGEAARRVSIPADDGTRRTCVGMAPFVTTTGGEYFLLPGRTSLRHLAQVARG